MRQDTGTIDPITQEIKEQIASVRENGYKTTGVVIGEEMFYEWSHIMDHSDLHSLKTGIHAIMSVNTKEQSAHYRFPTIGIFEDMPVYVNTEIPDMMPLVSFTQREDQSKYSPDPTTKGSSHHVDWSGWSGLTSDNHLGNVFNPPKPSPFFSRTPEEMEQGLIQAGQRIEKQKKDGPDDGYQE